MSVTVKFFASLREILGKSELSLAIETPTDITTLWEMATEGKPFPEHILIAINQHYVDSNSAVNNGDEVAFFPPVTGG